MDEQKDQPASIYSERYVAFIDILGFSDIVQNSVSSPKQASELVRVLERVAARTIPREYDLITGDGFRAQSFSDCIVLSENATDAGLEHLLFMVTSLALDLLANGILTRGGIAKGWLHHGEKVVMGPAMVAAYRLESTIAQFPRIVVDRETHADFKRIVAGGRRSPIATGLEGQLLYGDDGPVYVDIFAWWRDLSGATPERLLIVGADCRAAIQNHLNDSIYDPNIYKKSRWLAVEWNGVAINIPEHLRDRMEPVEFPSGVQIR